MNEIVVLGAGKSSSFLIEYLAKKASSYSYKLTVADGNLVNLKARTAQLENVHIVAASLEEVSTLQKLISDATIVVSLLPPFLHAQVAALCLELKKHLLTASYVSEEIQKMHDEAKNKNLLFLMECGLDPGLDHMSAMRILDNLKGEGAQILSFRSFCGGLVAPESEDNPWGYKITWNPRNVVLAGQGMSQYLENGEVKYIPYPQLFKRAELLFFGNFGEYEAYPNRDSLSYIPKYKLENVDTFLRGTIRKRGFCSAWQCLVDLGLTDDSIKIKDTAHLSVSEVFKRFCPKNKSIAEYLNIGKNSEDYQKLVWLGCESDEKLDIAGSVGPAEYLQVLLEKKWKLKDDDKDLVLMQHQIVYTLEGKKHELHSSLSVLGQNVLHTAMSKTVGLPLALATLLLYSGKINKRGVQIPTEREMYKPILEECQLNQILFIEDKKN
jgi:saccharopine dehydrogenase-like NADP-dependent oxidoreductase